MNLNMGTLLSLCYLRFQYRVTKAKYLTSTKFNQNICRLFFISETKLDKCSMNETCEYALPIGQRVTK